MQLNRKRGQLQAYFAGIIDGEGTIQVARAGNTYSSRVRVNMDDPEAIALLYREYPEGRIYKRSRNGRGRDYYSWVVTHFKAERFLKDIEPFRVIKRDQAKTMLAFLAHRRRDHRPIYHGKYGRKSADCGGRCDRFEERCRLQKQPDRNGVNSVNALLEHGLREYRAK